MVSATSPSPSDWSAAQVLRGLAWALLAVPVVMAFLFPQILPVLILLPLLSVAMVLPSMQNARLRRLFLASWFTSLLIVALVQVVLPLASEAATSPDLVLIVALVVEVTLIFVLLWRWSRLYAQMAALQGAQAGLERESAERSWALQRLLSDVEARAANQSDLLAEVQRRTHELTVLNAIGDLFRTSRTMEEAHSAIARLVQQLFPTDAGALCITSESRRRVHTIATWGGLMTEPEFTEDTCWVLHNSQEYLVLQGQSAPHCSHLRTSGAELLGVPLKAQGQTLGVLHLCPPTAGTLTEERKLLARMAAEHIALVLANLRLQESLRTQSVSDPLTGLYNRRYMEESLKREVRRVTRSQRPLGIMMIDVDHLRHYNDTYGYDMGDALLCELGIYLRANIRGGDIACRYEGEEFVLILPEAPLEVVTERAEQFRQAIRQLKAQRHGPGNLPVEPLTLSIGVASFPQHGINGEAALRAAVEALAQAKTRGGDAVVTASAQRSAQAAVAVRP